MGLVCRACMCIFVCLFALAWSQERVAIVLEPTVRLHKIIDRPWGWVGGYLIFRFCFGMAIAGQRSRQAACLLTRGNNQVCRFLYCLFFSLRNVRVYRVCHADLVCWENPTVMFLKWLYPKEDRVCGRGDLVRHICRLLYIWRIWVFCVGCRL